VSSRENQELNTEGWDRLQRCANRFEQAWKGGAPADLTEFLPPAGDPLRRRCLHELVKVDLEMRWRSGQPVVLEYYLEKLPELGPSTGLPVEVILEEYLVRHRHGDRPTLAIYRARFPSQYEDLARQVADHDLPTDRPRATGSLPAHLVPPFIAEPNAPTKRPGSAVSGPGKDSVLAVGGGYKLLERIGVGGFGEVWKAQAPGGVLTAVKIIPRPAESEAAGQELAALEVIKGLRHHFLLSTHAFWVMEESLVIAMDLAGGSLRDRLKECRKEGQQGLPVTELLLYMRETAEALDYLHGKDVLHRDIKPENILLVEGHVRLADFGLARVHQTMHSMHASGSGTPLYMPPEVWRDRVSRHSDQYSLAVTYCELRLGRRLWQSKTLVDLMNAHLEETPNLDPLGEAEQKVLLRALAKQTADRYPSCGAFVRDLEEAVVPGLGTLATQHTEPGNAKRDRGQASWTADTDWQTVWPGEEQQRPPRSSQTAVQQPESIWHPTTPNRRWWLVLPLLAVAVGGLAWALSRGGNSGEPNGGKDKKVGGPPLPAVAPAGPFRPVAGSATRSVRGKEYYEQIECVLTDGSTVRFLLIATDARKQVPPFYLMEDMVWNDLYAAFARARPDEAKDSDWKLGARAKRDGPKDMGVEGKNGRLPVMRVWVEDAYRFARWLGGLLPSEEEWDVAAGRWDTSDRKGPFLPDWKPGEIAVKRSGEGPMPVGAAAKDRSLHGCRDMAGNGMEWTRTYLHGTIDRGEYTGPGSIPPNTTRVRFILRSRSYADLSPLTFNDLEKGEPREQLYQGSQRGPYPDYEIGFRVVVRPAE
jgi:serine/threonine protein kinase